MWLSNSGVELEKLLDWQLHRIVVRSGTCSQEVSYNNDVQWIQGNQRQYTTFILYKCFTFSAWHGNEGNAGWVSLGFSDIVLWLAVVLIFCESRLILLQGLMQSGDTMDGRIFIPTYYSTSVRGVHFPMTRSMKTIIIAKWLWNGLQ